MVLAHLRGLLKPDYPHGVRSFLREKMVLAALEREIQGHSYIAKAGMEAASLPVIAFDSRRKTMQSSYRSLHQGMSLLQLMPFDKVMEIALQAERLTSEDQKMISMLKVLKKSNFYGYMDKVLKDALNS